MGRPKELDKPEPISLIIERAQLRYLQSNGMDRSKFMRQAVEAHKAGLWDYEFIKVDSDEEVEP